MKSTLFNFQQFSILQSKSAMKVGTDGVLLGAWTHVSSTDTNLLDIGTGTGLIALMLAQRFPNLKIDAIELDKDTAQEAEYNFSQSQWSNRLNCEAVSLQVYGRDTVKKYNHIVCNPPFFQEGYPIAEQRRNQARNNAFLTYETLFYSAHSLLKNNGSISLVIPISEANSVAEIAKKHGFFPLRITQVKGTFTSEIKRLLLTYSKQQNTVQTDLLVLEKARHQRTEAHQALVADFYLNKS